MRTTSPLACTLHYNPDASPQPKNIDDRVSKMRSLTGYAGWEPMTLNADVLRASDLWVYASPTFFTSHFCSCCNYYSNDRKTMAVKQT